MLQLIPDQGAQAPERLAHVGGLGAQPDTGLAIEPDHPLWLSRSSTPLPRLSTMFQPGPEDGELPINDERSRKPGSSEPADPSVDRSDRRLRQLQKLA